MLFCEARGLTRFEAVIAVVEPVDRNASGQTEPRNLVAGAKGVPLALENERRRLKGHQMIDAQFFGPARRVKRVAETNDTGNRGLLRFQFRRDHAGHAPAHGFAADDQAPADRHDRFPPRREQLTGWVGRTFFARYPSLGHVWKLEARCPDAS